MIDWLIDWLIYWLIFCFVCRQSMKLKLISSTVNAERRFSSWIGGSILASLVRWFCLVHIWRFFCVSVSGVKNSLFDDFSVCLCLGWKTVFKVLVFEKPKTSKGRIFWFLWFLDIIFLYKFCAPTMQNYSRTNSELLFRYYNFIFNLHEFTLPLAIAA